MLKFKIALFVIVCWSMRMINATNASGVYAQAYISRAALTYMAAESQVMQDLVNYTRLGGKDSICQKESAYIVSSALMEVSKIGSEGLITVIKDMVSSAIVLGAMRLGQYGLSHTYVQKPLSYVTNRLSKYVSKPSDKIIDVSKFVLFYVCKDSVKEIFQQMSRVKKQPVQRPQQGSLL